MAVKWSKLRWSGFNGKFFDGIVNGDEAVVPAFQLGVLSVKFQESCINILLWKFFPRNLYAEKQCLILSFPFRITFPESPDSKKRKHDKEDPKDTKQELLVEPFVVPNRGPYPFNQPKK